MVTVTIAGRPNVGKSTLFNALAGRSIAVTDHAAGTTRDILEAEISIPAGKAKVYRVTLVDSGGMGAVDHPGIRKKVDERIDRALARADAIIFLVDAVTGITDLDYPAADRVKKLHKPVILAANKCETEARELEAHVFGRLGLGAPIMIAAQEGRNIDALLERLALVIRKGRLDKTVSAAAVRKEKEAAEVERAAQPGKPPPAGRRPGPMRLAVLGRRNTGKSTFVNALAGEDRCIVSAIPGTTRDSLDVEMDYRGTKMTVIDTAGIVRHREGKSTIEFKSTVRTERAIRRSDVVMLFVDATAPVGRIEREAARLIGENFKPSIIVVNKWDLSTVSEDEFVKYLDEKLRFTTGHAVAFISAANKVGLDGLVQTAAELFEAAGRKLTTGILNRAAARFAEEHALPRSGTSIGKIYYAVQTGTYPPEFTLFVNHEEAFDDGYLRYMTRRLAVELGSEELPVRIILRGRRKPAHDTGKRR